MQHRHHIVPRHAGGTDDESNLTPPISVRLHAMFHYDRWKAIGDPNDYLAFIGLLRGISRESARRQALKNFWISKSKIERRARVAAALAAPNPRLGRAREGQTVTCDKCGSSCYNQNYRVARKRQFVACSDKCRLELLHEHTRGVLRTGKEVPCGQCQKMVYRKAHVLGRLKFFACSAKCAAILRNRLRWS